MKEIKQLLFEYNGDIKKIGDLPFAFISFNPDDLKDYSKHILRYETKEHFDKKLGWIGFIDDLIIEFWSELVPS